MNASGEAADQVVKIILEGSEFAIRMSGKGAIKLGTLLYAMSKEQNKTRGAERLTNMLRSGKPLKVYSFASKDMDKFKEVAKEYGILYTILKEKDKTGDVFDVFVRADDESKINRIVERFKLSKVDAATLRAEAIKDIEARDKKEGKGGEQTETEKKDEKPKSEGQEPPEKKQTEEEYEEGVAEKLLSDKPIQKDAVTQNPTEARADMQQGEREPEAHVSSPSESNQDEEKTENADLSEPTSKTSKAENKQASSGNEFGERESVRAKIERIKRERDAARQAERSTVKAPEIKTPTKKGNER